ncbi:helix-turn-helix transcriptional regulator [Gordonibacter sp.]
MQTPAACILATIGFACLTAWGTYIVFAPVLPLLSYNAAGVGIACLLVSRLAANIVLGICLWKADVVFTHLRRFLIPGALLFYGPAFIVAALAWQGLLFAVEPLSYVAWGLCGLGELSLSLTWTILFSMMSARWTAISIALGGALATPLFLLVAGSASPALGIGGIAFLLVVCGTLAFYLLVRTDDSSLATMRAYQQTPTISKRAAFSVSLHGLVYGFATIMLCLLGITSIMIAAAAGIIGSAMAILWALRRTKSKWDTKAVQRMTIPIVVAALLFIPFGGEAGRTVCGTIAVATLAYATLMEWTDQVVTNAEFQLFPVKRYASGRLAQWTGFLVGAFIAYLAFRAYPLTQIQLMLLTCVIAVLVVAAFSFYGADDSEAKQELFEIISSNVPIIDPPRNATPFRERCSAIIERYGLSAREAEVFMCLAKGRNVDYIQQTLFISSNTVKTHICHIYKKIGINSQQRLIDMVDFPTDL